VPCVRCRKTLTPDTSSAPANPWSLIPDTSSALKLVPRYPICKSGGPLALSGSGAGWGVHRGFRHDVRGVARSFMRKLALRGLPPRSNLGESRILPLPQLCLRHCGGGECGRAGCARLARRNLRCLEPVGSPTGRAANACQLSPP